MSIDCNNSSCLSSTVEVLGFLTYSMVYMKETKKVFVGMSGGVDSSVCAYLLKKQGYDVTGIHLRCWNRNGCDEKEARDARIVADQIGIPFYVFDMEQEYKQRVVDYMVEGYKNGLTPNPDVMCNREIKFGLFMEKALSMGADYVATGHYARIEKSGDEYLLQAGKDENKDQSYFLWTLNQEKLAHILFPIGDMTKGQVRKVAEEADLHVAAKKDSQGVCFVGQISLQEFLSEFLNKNEGVVLNAAGEAVGTHEGAHLYTIGQRHGLGVALNEPHYVAKKNIETNTVVLTPKEDESLKRSTVQIGNINLIGQGSLPENVFARIRYRQPLVEASLEITDRDNATLHFSEPVSFVAPGQSAVFYDAKGTLLGGGVIK